MSISVREICTDYVFYSESSCEQVIWGLRFAFKDRVVNQKPQTLTQEVEIACLSEEVLNE